MWSVPNVLVRILKFTTFFKVAMIIYAAQPTLGFNGTGSLANNEHNAQLSLIVSGIVLGIELDAVFK